MDSIYLRYFELDFAVILSVFLSYYAAKNSEEDDKLLAAIFILPYTFMIVIALGSIIGIIIMALFGIEL